MARINPGRMTATTDEGFVLFLIGMRNSATGHLGR